MNMTSHTSSTSPAMPPRGAAEWWLQSTGCSASPWCPSNTVAWPVSERCLDEAAPASRSPSTASRRRAWFSDASSLSSRSRRCSGAADSPPDALDAAALSSVSDDHVSLVLGRPPTAYESSARRSIRPVANDNCCDGSELPPEVISWYSRLTSCRRPSLATACIVDTHGRTHKLQLDIWNKHRTVNFCVHKTDVCIPVRVHVAVTRRNHRKSRSALDCNWKRLHLTG